MARSYTPVQVSQILAIEAVVFGGLLFGGAGTLDWPAAWVFLLLFWSCTTWLLATLYRHDRALFEERLKFRFQPGQPTWDKVFLLLLLGVWIPWLVLMGVDAVRYGWTHVPLQVQQLAAVGFVVANYLIHLTFRANTFTAPTVRVQSERAHHVIDTGPYALVRHPMYASMLLYLPSVALLLGSLWGVAVALLMVGLLAIRLLGEEKELEQHLEGYRAYEQQVPYRLIPGLW